MKRALLITFTLLLNVAGWAFADEVIDELLLIRITLANHFDRQSLDKVARPMLLGLIDNPHSAPAHGHLDPVAKQLGPDAWICRNRHAYLTPSRTMGGR